MNAPIVFQCGSCHRVLSDSNQLLSAVAELGVLVLDAVVGVKAADADAAKKLQNGGGSSSADNYLPLHCSACEHVVGRLYEQAPQLALVHLVHRPEAPRYCLVQDALASYVLGSAGLPVDTAAEESEEAAADSAKRQKVTDAAAATRADGIAAAATVAAAGDGSSSLRLDALESSDANVRQQLAQLMRVVLALDQRLRGLEESGASAAAAGQL